MTGEYVYVNGQDGEVYEIRPTDGLLRFLQEMAEKEMAEQENTLDKGFISTHKGELTYTGI